jgi:hypothetical protein
MTIAAVAAVQAGTAWDFSSELRSCLPVASQRVWYLHHAQDGQSVILKCVSFRVRLLYPKIMVIFLRSKQFCHKLRSGHARWSLYKV